MLALTIVRAQKYEKQFCLTIDTELQFGPNKLRFRSVVGYHACLTCLMWTQEGPGSSPGEASTFFSFLDHFTVFFIAKAETPRLLLPKM